MKKFALLGMLAVLNGCLYAGDNGNYLIGSRANFFAALQGYHINFYDNKPVLEDSQLVNERNYVLNQSKTAARGYSVLNNKFYQKEVYRQMSVRPNMNGTLSSASISQRFSINDKFDIIGEVKIDGVVYRLIPSDIPDYVFLFNKDGVFYDKMGQIKGSTLVLLDPDFLPMPKSLRMMEVVSTKTNQTKPVQGFDVKYEGVNLDRIWFTYFAFDNASANSGNFQKLSFPNKPGLIEINGVGMRVINANNDKIDYIVVKD